MLALAAPRWLPAGRTRLGEGGTLFPEVPASEKNPAMLTGFVPGSPTGSILTLAGGAGLAAFSGAFTEPYLRIPALLAGIAAAAVGAVGLARSLTGVQEPTIISRPVPPGQTARDLKALRVRILKPGKGAEAEVTNTWSSIFTNTPSTYALEFEVENTGPKSLLFVAEWHHKEFSRAGKTETAEYTTAYVLEVPPGEIRTVKGFQPFKGAFFGVDVVADVRIRGSNAAVGAPFANVDFSILP